MNTRIAAFFDATNMLSDVTSGRFVSVYSKINNKWKAVDRFTLSEVVFSSIDQPELYAKELLKQLGNIAVSYTHLDVYKRQVCILCIPLLLKVTIPYYNGVIYYSYMAVSYTHLASTFDVSTVVPSADTFSEEVPSVISFPYSSILPFALR